MDATIKSAMFTTKNLLKLAGKHLLVAIIAVVVTVGIVLFISGQITKVSATAIKERHLAALLSERTALLSNLKHEIEIIGSNDITIKKAFIPSNNILGFVSILESIALKNSVTQSFHFSSPVPAVIATSFPLATISYQNTVSSNISTFINYLRDFESLPYFTKIDSLSISSGGADWNNTSAISFNASVAAETIQ